MTNFSYTDSNYTSFLYISLLYYGVGGGGRTVYILQPYMLVFID